MVGAIVEQQGLLLEVEEPEAACAGGCQARMPPLAHANFRLEDHCDEAGGDTLRLPDARTCCGIAGVVAKNFALGILTTGPGVAVLLLLAELARGRDRAPLLFGACIVSELAGSALTATGALWGCYSVAHRAEDLFFWAPLSLATTALAVPAVLLACVRWVPNWEYVNRQCLAWTLCSMGHHYVTLCLGHGAKSALEGIGWLPRRPWWRRQTLAAELLRFAVIISLYAVPFALALLGASSLRYHLTHECKRSAAGHYAIILGFLCAHSVTTKLFSQGAEKAATSDRHGELVGASEEDQMGPLQTAKIRAVLTSTVSFPMALAGKLLVTALQSWHEALVISCLNTVIEISETVRALRAVRAAMEPLTEFRGCLEAIETDLGEVKSDALTDNLQRYQERLAEERRRMGIIATKIIAEQMGEYQLMTAVVSAALIFTGSPIVDGFTNGDWSSTQVLLFLATQFVPELVCDFISLCYVQNYGVDVQGLHSKVHNDPALLAHDSLIVARWLAFATLAAEKRLWGA